MIAELEKQPRTLGNCSSRLPRIQCAAIAGFQVRQVAYSWARVSACRTSWAHKPRNITGVTTLYKGGTAPRPQVTIRAQVILTAAGPSLPALRLCKDASPVEVPLHLPP